jgi:hypothetical protein
MSAVSEILLLFSLIFAAILIAALYLVYFKSGLPYNELILYFAVLFKISFLSLYITILWYLVKFISSFGAQASALIMLFLILAFAGVFVLWKDGYIKQELKKIKIK